MQATLDLYRAETYEALGMFDVWGHSQTNMQRQYNAHGLDIGNYFPRWTRSGIFMYTPNHPRVNVILDVVRGALAEAGMAAVTGVDKQVIDYYHEQTVLPVYPEIAERFGLVGGTYWKRHKVEKLISYDRFVFDSFEMYSTMDREKLLTNQVSPILKSPVFS